MVGLSRFELLTPRLSSVCSNQLSYRPSSPTYFLLHELVKEPDVGPILSKLDRRVSQTLAERLNAVPCCSSNSVSDRSSIMPHFRNGAEPLQQLRAISRKEVIQPQVLLQLPCYDFTPITDHTLGACLPCGLAQRLLVQPAFVM
jgi:hypothetical protein